MTGHSDTGKAMRARRLATGQKCRIRPPHFDDYEKMADLADQLGYPSAVQQIRLRIERMQDEDHSVLVAEVPAGNVAGWIGMHIFRSVELDEFTFITGLIVDEAFRSQEIGKALLDAAEEWARRRGCHSVCVSSNVVRDRAHGFYMRNGYKNVKTQITFLKELQKTEICANRPL